VTTADIAGAVAAAGGPSVDKRKIEIGQSIKTTGDYTVSIRLHPEVSAKIGVQVVAG
jgi:large subunit ribosomal protein L9